MQSTFIKHILCKQFTVAVLKESILTAFGSILIHLCSGSLLCCEHESLLMRWLALNEASNLFDCWLILSDCCSQYFMQLCRTADYRYALFLLCYTMLHHLYWLFGYYCHSVVNQIPSCHIQLSCAEHSRQLYCWELSIAYIPGVLIYETAP